MFIEFFKNFFGLRRRFENKTKLDDKVVVITGGNTGIGKETAYQLSLKGAKVCSHNFNVSNYIYI